MPKVNSDNPGLILILDASAKTLTNNEKLVVFDAFMEVITRATMALKLCVGKRDRRERVTSVSRVVFTSVWNRSRWSALLRVLHRAGVNALYSSAIVLLFVRAGHTRGRETSANELQCLIRSLHYLPHVWTFFSSRSLQERSGRTILN